MASKYFIIATDLEKKIPTFFKDFDGKFPSESTLCKEYGVSRQTVRSALSLLIQENYITSIPGSGYKLTGKLPSIKNRISLIVPYKDQYIYPAFISQIETILKKRDFTLDTFQSENSYHIEKQILENLTNDTPRLIVAYGINTAFPNPNMYLYNQLRERGCPILFLNSTSVTDYFTFSHDSFWEGMHATETLHKLGHEKVAGIFPVFDADGIDMYKGWLFTQWQKSNLTDPISCLYSNEDIYALRFNQDYSFLSNWVETKLKDCTSIVCYNDEIAYWVIKALNHNGFSCPEDISVTGADGSYLSTLSVPMISTFSYTNSDYAKEICDYISTILAGTAEKNKKIKRSFVDCPSISRIAPLSL